MSCDHYKDCCTNTTGVQSLDELDFERGIWYAAQYGNLQKIEQLVRQGCYVDKRDLSGYTALHYAARNGQLEVCKLLIKQGAEINAVTRGGVSAMCRAASMGKAHKYH